MKHYALIALLLTGSAFADKRIEEVKKAAQAQGIELTFEMSTESFNYATGLKKNPRAGGRPKIDKRFLADEIKVPGKFDTSEFLKNLPAGAKLCDIHDQGNCGSCVINALLGAMCDQSAIHGVPIPMLSREQAMNCGNGMRCNGYWGSNAIKDAAAAGGYVAESEWPYSAPYEQSCRQMSGTKYGKVVGGPIQISNAHKSVFTAILKGYIPINTIGADNAWMGYKSGVYNYCSGQGTNHQIRMTGWDCGKSVDADGYCIFDEKGNIANGEGYGIWTNSWNVRWGEEGKIRSKFFRAGTKQLCNNINEDVLVFDMELPELPKPKPPEPPAPPTPAPFKMPTWLIGLLIGLAGLLAGIFGSRLFKK